MNKPLLEALSGNSVSPPPLWLMRQAGRYLPEYMEVRQSLGSFLDLCYSPEQAVEVTLQPIRRFNFDASIIFSDILVIPDAMGVSLDYVKGEGPKLGKITTEQEVDELHTDRIQEHLSPVFEALRRVKQELPSHTALIGFAGAPWTVATYMLEGGSSKDFSEARHFAYRYPEAFKLLLDKLVDTTSEYLCAQVNAGAEVVQLFDSWAGVLPEAAWVDWVLDPTQRIVSKVKERYPDIPFIGFPKGSGVNYERFIKETGVNAVSIDYTVPCEWAAKYLQPHGCVQGNLDPMILAHDKKQALCEARHIIDILGKGPFIFNLGHGILPHTPIEHVEALITTVRQDEGVSLAQMG